MFNNKIISIMKKFLFAALALCIVNGAIAQGIKLGVKAGANLSTITDVDDAKMKLGFHVGGFLEFKFSESLSLQPELLFSMQGAKQDGDVSVTMNMDYFNVPVMLKVNFAEGLSAEVGPQLGFLVGGVDGNTEIDLSGAAGLSYTFAEKFVIGARYCFGLTKIFKDSKFEDIEFKQKNSVIQFSLGYKF